MRDYMTICRSGDDIYIGAFGVIMSFGWSSFQLEG